jgi:hypothetical protein
LHVILFWWRDKGKNTAGVQRCGDQTNEWAANSCFGDSKPRPGCRNYALLISELTQSQTWFWQSSAICRKRVNQKIIRGRVTVPFWSAQEENLGEVALLIVIPRFTEMT